MTSLLQVTAQLVRVNINADGSAGAPETLALSGLTFSNTDGLAWAGNNTLYTTLEGNSVAKISVEGTNATVENFVADTEGVGPTSLAVITLASQPYLFINDGQLVAFLQGQAPTLPFTVVVKPL